MCYGETRCVSYVWYVLRRCVVCIAKIHGVLNRPFTNMLSSGEGKEGWDGLGMSLMGEQFCWQKLHVCPKKLHVFSFSYEENFGGCVQSQVMEITAKVPAY